MIVQIIEKLNRMKNLDCIILSTTTNDTDDELAAIAERAGALIIKGPEHNLLERDNLAIHIHNLDYVIPVSGDCPFLSNEVMQLLIDNVEEGYDFFSPVGTYCSIPGFFSTAFNVRVMKKYERLMESYREKYSYEQYWLSGNESPSLFETKQIDTSHIAQKEITPMKLSIDWNFERLIFNKVIEWLGYYPETIEDFNKAYRGIEEL